MLATEIPSYLPDIGTILFRIPTLREYSGNVLTYFQMLSEGSRGFTMVFLYLFSCGHISKIVATAMKLIETDFV